MGMHWPTQITQFTITLIITGIRAFIRRAPQSSNIFQSISDEPNTISDKHEMDWLASKSKKMTFKKFKNPIEPWQLMTAASLSNCQDEENNHKEIEEQNFVLNRRCRLGTLCKWTGTERKWVISLATAIDSIINIFTNGSGPGHIKCVSMGVGIQSWRNDTTGFCHFRPGGPVFVILEFRSPVLVICRL
jgi:hypothetical protein